MSAHPDPLVLAVNSGSSSLKAKLYAGARLAAGARIERIGEADGRLSLADSAGRMETHAVSHPHHGAALRDLLDNWQHSGVLRAGALAAVGHRVVHGGARFTSPAAIDGAVIDALRALFPLAPLHNPLALEGIEAVAQSYPALPQVAVFDTAFHHTLPPAAYRYGLPLDLVQSHGVRRYGFHGISIQHVASQLAQQLARPLTSLNLIVLHLGNGASASALQNGASIDTSMGMTPLEGLLMGSRCGDLDPAVPLFLQRATGLDVHQVEDLLERKSGLRGLTGHTDLRDVHALAAQGDAEASLALDIYCRRIRKYVGAYIALLERVDALVFTGGVGEHDAVVRERSVGNLEALGLELDPAANTAAGGEARPIHADSSRSGIWVIPTDEELEIARQTRACLKL